MDRVKSKTSWVIAACFAFVLACTKPPTVLFRPLSKSIPDGLTICLFTAEPPTSFQFQGGHLLQRPFAPSVLSAKGKPIPSSIHPKRRVKDWLHLPESDRVAVLTESERWGYWPPDLLAMLAGHPIPHNTFYIEIYNSAGELIVEAKCLTGTYLSATIDYQPAPPA